MCIKNMKFYFLIIVLFESASYVSIVIVKIYLLCVRSVEQRPNLKKIGFFNM